MSKGNTWPTSNWFVRRSPLEAAPEPPRDEDQGFCFATAFIRAEARMRGDPVLRTDAEAAMLNGRLRIVGLVATLDEEVIGHGYANIPRHYSWALCGGRTPLHDGGTLVAPRGTGWLLAGAERAVEIGWIVAIEHRLRHMLQGAVRTLFSLRR